MRGAYLMNTRDTSPPWRVLGKDSQPEVYIPLGPHPRSRAAMAAVLSLLNPSDEDRARWAAEAQAQAEADAAQLDAHIARHPLLVEAHKANPILTVFLTEHAPHRETPTYAVCLACPGVYDEDEPGCHTTWPCQPWGTIAEHTPTS